MNFTDPLVRMPKWTIPAAHAVFSVPVEEHHLPDQNAVYTIGNRLYVPRWLYLLCFEAKRDHLHALELLEQRYIDDVDRRLKEKNL